MRYSVFIMTSSTQKIIDSHMHLWDLSLKKHAWLQEPMAGSFLWDYTSLTQNYLPEDYLADTQGFAVEKTVYVQAGWDQKDPLGEVTWVEAVGGDSLGAMVPYVDLSSKNAARELAQLAEHPLVRGVRQIVAWHQNPVWRACERDFLDDPIWGQQFKLLAQHQFTFDLQIYPEQAEQAYQLLKKHPHIPVVIEHSMMLQSHEYAALREWEKKIKRLAELPQVCIKISGLNLFVHDASLPAYKPLLETMVHHFSPSRCMIGSNFPVERLFVPFSSLFQAFFQMAGQYSPSERDALFYETARGFYRIP